MLKSRSSDSFTSQLKDFIAPVPIDLTNCGKVIIRKQTIPDGATDSFGFTKAFATDPATPNTFSLTDGGSQDFAKVLLGSGYTVTEDQLPAGWELTGIDCSASKGVTPTIAGATLTFDLDSTTDVLDCTYTNAAKGKLTVVKETADGSGAFDFTTTGGLTPATFTLTTTAEGATGSASRTFTDLSPATYGVSETVPAGWNLSSATCDNGQSPDAVTIEAGANVTCTFTNARERGAILITKTRKHAAAEGGEGPQAGVTFTVKAPGMADVIGVTADNGTLCVPNLLYGDYTVTETVPAGYVSDDFDKAVTVSTEADCSGLGTPAGVSFLNTPLTNITVSVDSIIDGGTASTIVCVDADGNVVVSNTTNAPGDVSVTASNLLPTAPGTTLVCTIVVDP